MTQLARNKTYRLRVAARKRQEPGEALDRRLTKELSQGDQVPSFRLTTDDAGEISSASLKGAPYVLFFYPKDDTAGCTKEAISFSKEQRKFLSLGVTVVGVSKDSIESHAKFRKKYNLSIALASDTGAETGKNFGVWIEKSLYGRRYMGMDRATFLVDRAGIINTIWRRVKIPGHVEAVLQAARRI